MFSSLRMPFKTSKIQTDIIFLALSFQILNILNYHLQNEHDSFKFCGYFRSLHCLGHLNLIFVKI